jgi:hypothetical protein
MNQTGHYLTSFRALLLLKTSFFAIQSIQKQEPVKLAKRHWDVFKTFLRWRGAVDATYIKHSKFPR